VAYEDAYVTRWRIEGPMPYTSWNKDVRRVIIAWWYMVALAINFIQFR